MEPRQVGTIDSTKINSQLGGQKGRQRRASELILSSINDSPLISLEDQSKTQEYRHSEKKSNKKTKISSSQIQIRKTVQINFRDPSNLREQDRQENKRKPDSKQYEDNLQPQ